MTKEVPLTYKGKKLSELTLWELQVCITEFHAAEARREEAREHEKFKDMEFPKPNPKYLELKEAILTEIQKRQSHA